MFTGFTVRVFQFTFEQVSFALAGGGGGSDVCGFAMDLNSVVKKFVSQMLLDCQYTEGWTVAEKRLNRSMQTYTDTYQKCFFFLAVCIHKCSLF
jgi:hypothetical protein